MNPENWPTTGWDDETFARKYGKDWTSKRVPFDVYDCRRLAKTVNRECFNGALTDIQEGEAALLIALFGKRCGGGVDKGDFSG